MLVWAVGAPILHDQQIVIFFELGVCGQIDLKAIHTDVSACRSGVQLITGIALFVGFMAYCRLHDKSLSQRVLCLVKISNTM